MAEDGLLKLPGLKERMSSHDFDTCNAFMVISSIRLQLMEFNRRHDNDPRSIGELFYSVRSEITVLHLLKFCKHYFYLLIISLLP